MTSEFVCTVFAYLPGQRRAVPAGLLKMQEDASGPISSLFGYGSRYLQRPDAVPLDPSTLRLEGAVPGSRREVSPPNGLTHFGAMRDAMPDFWGRRVIESKLKVPANSLRESEYMIHAGSNRLGALDFRDSPGADEQEGLLVPASDLSYLVEAADRVQRGEPVPEALSGLFSAGPTMGGARPKAVVIRAGVQYVAKFPAAGDAFDVPVVERATLELARACGLRVPATDIVRLPDGRNVMLIERFDRVAIKDGWSRKPVVSALTAMELHESESATSSYAALSQRLASVSAVGTSKADATELFKRMVFNILVSNDDDHLRNHALLWEPASRGWTLSPLYDVLPKPQVGTDRQLHLGVGKQGRRATLDNALSNAGAFGLLPGAALEIVEDLAAQVREWRTFFESMGVNGVECDKIKLAFRKPRDIGLR